MRDGNYIDSIWRGIHLNKIKISVNIQDFLIINLLLVINSNYLMKRGIEHSKLFEAFY